MQARTIAPLENVLFESMLKVRISDINYGNHLGHDSLISLLHDARVQFIEHYGYTELEVCGFGMIMANINVNYLAQAFYPDTLSVSIGVGEKSKSSIELVYQVKSTKQGKEIARASTIMVFYDYKKNRVVRVPEEFVAKLAGKTST